MSSQGGSKSQLADQSCLDDVVQEYPVEEDDDADHQEANINSATSKVRGRKRVPECWTRVISTRQDDLEKLKVYPLASDLLLGSALSGAQSKVRERQWAPLFSSKDFLRQQAEI